MSRQSPAPRIRRRRARPRSVFSRLSMLKDDAEIERMDRGGVSLREGSSCHLVGRPSPRRPNRGGLFQFGSLVPARAPAQHRLPGPPESPWLSQARAPTEAIGPGGRAYAGLRRLIPWLRYGYSPRLVGWLRAHARNYDAVVVNGLWNYASFGAWRALHDTQTPYFVFTHGMLDPWFNTAYPTRTFFKSIFWRLFEHRVLRDAAGVMFTCDEERRLAGKSFAPYQAREFVVGYGTRDVSGEPEAQRAAFFAEAPTALGRKLVLFLSRVHEKKGVDLLIEAFARHAASRPDYDLVIAGPDPSGLRRAVDQERRGPRRGRPHSLAGHAQRRR